MARVADPQKRVEWVERLRRFETSSTTVEHAFCEAEGVSTASFYQSRDRPVGEAFAASAQDPAAFVPVHLAAASEVAIHLPGGVSLPCRRASGNSSSGPSPCSCVPLRRRSTD